MDFFLLLFIHLDAGVFHLRSVYVAETASVKVHLSYMYLILVMNIKGTLHPFALRLPLLEIQSY